MAAVSNDSQALTPTCRRLLDVADIELPDLVAVIVEDARNRVELLVEDTRTRIETQARALGADVGERLTELAAAVQASLIAVGVTIVTAMLLGLAIAATLTELGLPWYGALWIVTALALGGVATLVRRARRSGRRVIAPFTNLLG